MTSRHENDERLVARRRKKFIVDPLFTILTSVTFDPARIRELIRRAVELRDALRLQARASPMRPPGHRRLMPASTRR